MNRTIELTAAVLVLAACLLISVHGYDWYHRTAYGGDGVTNVLVDFRR